MRRDNIRNFAEWWRGPAR